MSSALSTVPIDRRRRAARGALLLAVVMAVVFVVAWVRPAPGVVRLFASVALVGALMLGLMSWGLVRSIRLDTADRTVAAAIDGTAATMCDCGREHNPDELQVTDASCERGASCDHSCATCRVGPSSADPS